MFLLRFGVDNWLIQVARVKSPGGIYIYIRYKTISLTLQVDLT